MGLFFIKNDTRWNPFLWLCILFGHTSPFALLLPFAPFSFALLAFVLNCVIRCHSACRGNPFVFVVICGFHNLWKLIIGHCYAYICTPQKQQQVVHTTCRCSTLFGGYLCTKFVCSTLNIHHSGTYTRIEWLHIRHWYCCCCYPHILSVFLSFNFGFSCNSTWTHEWNFMKFLPCFFSVFTLEWNFSFCFVLYSLHESPTENDDCLSSGRQAKVVRWIFSFQSENFNAIYSILISLRA